ncbi:MAG: IS701 family transposase [Isosphaeraceae bacterium]
MGRPMLREHVDAAAARLDEAFTRFASCFGKAEARRHALNYVRGLMVCPERKSIEPIAKSVGGGKVSGLQKFINIAPWKTGDVNRQMQLAFAERFESSPGPGYAGTIGVISENAFTKKGTGSAGVARQVNPRTRRTENCQLGVYLTAVASGGMVLLGERLYLPKEWWRESAEAQAQREKVHIPRGLGFQSRAEIASELVRRHAVRSLVRLDWVTCSDVIADVGDVQILLNQRYAPVVAGVPLATRFLVESTANPLPGERAVLTGGMIGGNDLAASLKPGAWREAGRGGGLIRECAALRVRYGMPTGLSPPAWLLLERATSSNQTVTSAYISNSGSLPPAEVLASAAEARARANAFFEESVALLGMAQYETRSWIGWHHHMTLVGLAHLLVTLTRGDGSFPS